MPADTDTITTTDPLATRSAQAGLPASSAGDVHLSAAQLRFFEVFGFLRLPGLLRDIMPAIDRAFETLWTQHGGGHQGMAHAGTQRSCIPCFIEHSEELSSLLEDPRIHGAACSLLGENFNYMGSDGNLYVGDTHWHRDGGHRGISHIKILVYLDPLTRAQGALRVIPGTHRIDDRYAQESGEAAMHPETVGMRGAELPDIALEVVPGDVLIFNHNLLHASFGGGTRRRMFTYNLSQRYAPERLGELAEHLASGARFLIPRAFAQRFITTAGALRRRHIEQPLAHDGLLRERSAMMRAGGHAPARG